MPPIGLSGQREVHHIANIAASSSATIRAAIIGQVSLIVIPPGFPFSVCMVASARNGGGLLSASEDVALIVLVVAAIICRNCGGTSSRLLYSWPLMMNLLDWVMCETTAPSFPAAGCSR